MSGEQRTVTVESEYFLFFFFLVCSYLYCLYVNNVAVSAACVEITFECLADGDNSVFERNYREDRSFRGEDGLTGTNEI